MKRMLAMMSKDFLLSLALFLAVAPGAAWYWLDTRDVLDQTVTVMQLGLLFTWSIFLLFNIELREHRSRAYRFFDTLPLTRGEVAGAKLLLIAAGTIAFSIVSWWVFARLGGSRGGGDTSMKLLAVATPLVLCASALAYAGLFRYGFEAVSWLLVVVIMAGYTAPIVIMEYLVDPGRLAAGGVVASTAWPHVAGLSAVCVIGWMLAALLAVRTRMRRYE